MNSAVRVDEFIARQPQWQAQLETLRKILQGPGLEEGIRWRALV